MATLGTWGATRTADGPRQRRAGSGSVRCRQDIASARARSHRGATARGIRTGPRSPRERVGGSARLRAGQSTRAGSPRDGAIAQLEPVGTRVGLSTASDTPRRAQGSTGRPRRARAHAQPAGRGGAHQVDGQPVGPFALYCWQSPQLDKRHNDRARAGRHSARARCHLSQCSIMPCNM
jgi:hypothetical protein